MFEHWDDVVAEQDGCSNFFQSSPPIPTYHSRHVSPRPSKGGAPRVSDALLTVLWCPNVYQPTVPYHWEIWSKSYLRRFTVNFRFKDLLYDCIQYRFLKIDRSASRFALQNVTQCRPIKRHIACCSNIPLMSGRSCPCKFRSLFRLGMSLNCANFWTTKEVTVWWPYCLEWTSKQNLWTLMWTVN